MLRQDVDYICSFAQETFVSDGFISPLLFGIFEGKKKIIMIDFDISEHKQQFVDKIKSLISQDKLSEYIFVGEAWVLKSKKSDDINQSIKDHPARQECIVVQYCHPSEEIHFFCTINRGIDKEVTFGEWEQINVNSVGQGRFQSLFTKGRAEWN